MACTGKFCIERLNAPEEAANLKFYRRNNSIRLEMMNQMRTHQLLPVSNKTSNKTPKAFRLVPQIVGFFITLEITYNNNNSLLLDARTKRYLSVMQESKNSRLKCLS